MSLSSSRRARGSLVQCGLDRGASLRVQRCPLLPRTSYYYHHSSMQLRSCILIPSGCNARDTARTQGPGRPPRLRLSGSHSGEGEGAIPGRRPPVAEPGSEKQRVRLPGACGARQGTAGRTAGSVCVQRPLRAPTWRGMGPDWVGGT